MSEVQSIDLGGIRVTRVSGGINWMDGGTMLGILPKAIWSRWYPADEDNRIALDTHCLVVETPHERILIESGCGNKLTEKERAFYGAVPGDWIVPNLEKAGFARDSFDRVVLTHLHTDHAGGVLMRNEEGILEPSFPGAMVNVGELELEDAQVGYGISPNAYDPVNYTILLDRGMLTVVPFDGEIVPKIRCLSTPGHTRGHLSVLIEGSKEKLLFTGDILPLARQSVPHFNMSFEVDPVEKAHTKRRLLEKAYQKDWILVLSHEPICPVGRLKYDSEKKRYDLLPWSPED